MKKGILQVFAVIAILVVAMLAWDIVFNDGGVVEVVYTQVTTPINEVWQSITGDTSAILIPEWGSGGSTLDGDMDYGDF